MSACLSVLGCRSSGCCKRQAAATTHHGGDQCDGRNDEKINNCIAIINRNYYFSDLRYFEIFWPVTAVVVALQWQHHCGKTDNNFWRAGTADLQGKAALLTILHSASVNCLIVGLFLVCGAMTMPIMVILSWQRPWSSSWSSIKNSRGDRQTIWMQKAHEKTMCKFAKFAHERTCVHFWLGYGMENTYIAQPGCKGFSGYSRP